MEILTNFEVAAITSLLEEVISCFPENSFFREYFESLYKVTMSTFLIYQIEECILERNFSIDLMEKCKKNFEISETIRQNQIKVIRRLEENELKNIRNMFIVRLHEEDNVTQAIRKLYRKNCREFEEELLKRPVRISNEDNQSLCTNASDILSSIKAEIQELQILCSKKDKDKDKLENQLNLLHLNTCSPQTMASVAKYIKFIFKQNNNKKSNGNVLELVQKRENQEKHKKKNVKKRGKKRISKNKDKYTYP